MNDFCQTPVPHIYAVRDTIGPPVLASASMEQDRRTICYAFSVTPHPSSNLTPAGIYTISEMATVGLTEQQAIEEHGGTEESTVEFSQVAQAHIMPSSSGFLRLVADVSGHRLLGVKIAGDGATELLHLGQMALLNNMSVEALTTTLFSFPTMAEAYRLAALDIIHRRDAHRPPGLTRHLEKTLVRMDRKIASHSVAASAD